MSRQEEIDSFNNRIIKHIGLKSKVAYVQLSNVYKD
jgi:hypothetical protein